MATNEEAKPGTQGANTGNTEQRVQRNQNQQDAGSSASEHVVTLDPAFGVGEFVVDTGDDPRNPKDEDRVSIVAGRNTPVGAKVYDLLPRDAETGELRYPLVEVGKENG